MRHGTGDQSARRRGPGELEAEVLGALWASPEPLPPGRVRQALGGDLAYNTVHTILVRLHEKGLVRRSVDGRAHVYAPAKPAADLVAERMHNLLDHGPDRQAILQSFAGSLSQDDEKTLLSILRHLRGD